MILVTNDDGIRAHGIRWLAEAAAPFGEVFIAAPDRERSNIGMGITLDQPLRAYPSGKNAYAVSGTPVDCIDLAVGELMPRPPVLCVAGVNLGQNLGHDVHFSGTVGAARKAFFLGVPSIAISMPRGKKMASGDGASLCGALHTGGAPARNAKEDAVECEHSERAVERGSRRPLDAAGPCAI